MSTQRQDNNIISSSLISGTIRDHSSIISSDASTQILSSSLTNDIFLNDKKYTILSQIARSGEAEVFLVSSDTQKLIFKYYYSQFKPKDEVVNKLKGLKHVDIISLIDFGYYEQRFFEITEYAEGGTLSDIMPVTSLSKTQEIVSETIEALNYCHNHGIIHRDIKPENIFFRTADKKDIAIGDFGIASNLTQGEELVRTTLARTSLYAAPELFTNIQGRTIIEKSVDYYALGMTLLHLWVGKNPFEDVDEFGIMRLKSEGRVLFPDGIDPDVEKLIKGLITVNPRDRWSYNEVKNWLNGEDVKVLYQTIKLEYKPYSFGLIDGEQIVVNNPKDLAGLLEKYPEKGEGHLYRNTIAKWIEQVDQGLFNDLMDIVEKEFPKDRTAGLTKAIYILDQDRPFKGADKTKLRTQEEIANYFEENAGHYQTDLKNPNASFFIFLESRNYKQKAEEYRGYFSNYNSELALNSVIHNLQGSDKYIIKDVTIYQPQELLKLPSELMSKVIQDLANTNSKLSLWITSFTNLEPTINKWRVLKRYNELTLRYALEEGFVFNGEVSKSEKEFYDLFKNNNDSFFILQDNKTLQKEADYWLVNYQNTSLTRTAISYLKSENYPEKNFLVILNYILKNYKSESQIIYPIIEELLKVITSKTSENIPLLERTIEICEVSIKESWVEQQAASKEFIDCLKEYLQFAEANFSQYSEFISQLTYQLDDRISSGIRNDLNFCRADEKKFNKYRINVKTTTQRLNTINSQLPYLVRYQKEFELIGYEEKVISSKLSDEKKSKLDITQDTYSKILEKRRETQRGNTKKGFVKKFVISSAIAVIAFALLLITIENSENSLMILTGALVILGIGLGILAGIMTENLWVAIVACILLGWLAGKYGPLIPIKSIYVMCCITVAFFGGRAILLNYKREKSISENKLNNTEESGLKQSLQSVDDHFIKKEHFEHYDETLRLLQLDDEAFNSEYTSKQSKFTETDNATSYLVGEHTDFTKELAAINTPITGKLKFVNYSVGALILLTFILGIWKYATTDQTYLGSDHNYSGNSSYTNNATYYSVSASSANIRERPSKNGRLLMTLSHGTVIEVLNTGNSEWFKVRYNGTEGYMNSKLISYGNSSTNTNSSNSTSSGTSVSSETGNSRESIQKQLQWVTCPECDGTGKKPSSENCHVCTTTGLGGMTYSGYVTCTTCKGNGSYKCTTCNGGGNIGCTQCNKTGNVYCSSCKGSGRIGNENCPTCSGYGTQQCVTCRGYGRSTCVSCRGYGKYICETCKQTGKMKCNHCSGTGKDPSSVECSNCSGKGQIQQEI